MTITDTAQLTGRAADIHRRTIVAGFTFMGFVPLLDGATRMRYQHHDGRTCFTDVDPSGVLLDTTADLTGNVDITSPDGGRS